LRTAEIEGYGGAAFCCTTSSAGGLPVSLPRRWLAAGALGAIAVATVAGIGDVASGRTASALDSTARVPVPAELAVSRSLGTIDRSYWIRPTAGGLVASSSAQKLSERFARGSVAVRRGRDRLGLAVRSLSRPGLVTPLAAARPSASRNRVVYSRASLLEWYANGPMGLEQGFTLTRRPTGSGSLSLAMALSGSLTPKLNERGTAISMLDPHGRAVLRYTGLSATDAAGRAVPAWLGLSGHRLTLHVNDRGARYPLRIDPFIQAAELTTGDTGGEVGWSLGISGDTIAAGAPTYPGDGSTVGAVYVFVKPVSGWADMTSPTAKLTDSNSAGGDHLGQAVGISGDTIVAGAHGNGYADVWVKPGGGWATTTTATARLTDTAISGNTGFGQAVAISGDTIVVGNFAGQQGYVYVKPNTGWANATLPNATLSGGVDGVFLAQSVAISDDTVALGDPGYHVNLVQEGGVFVYVKPVAGWGTAGQNQTLTRTALLTGSGINYDFELGQSVSIDGSTIVAGAPLWKNGASAQVGAAYVFTKPNTGWADGTQTAVLTASDGGNLDEFGSSVGVAGSTIAVGTPQGFTSPNNGAVYVFQEPGGGWADSTESQKLTASNATTNLDLGKAVAIDGSTIAGSADTAQEGRVYVFAPSPVCTWTPTSGTEWHTAANWDCGHVPTSSDDVVINSGTAHLTGADASARSLSINTGAPSSGGLQIQDHTLTVSSSGTSTLNGFLDVQGTLILNDPTTYEGTTDSGGINVQGTLEIGSTFEMTSADGGAGNNSQINDTSGGKTSLIQVLASGSIVRDTSSGTLSIGPRVDNDGSVSVKTGTLDLNEGDAGNTTGSYAVSSGAVLGVGSSGGAFEAPSITGAGTLDVAGGTTTVGPSDTFSLPGLNIHGNGTFTLNKSLSITKFDTAGSGASNGGTRDGTGTLTLTGSTDFSDLHLNGGTTTVAASVPSLDLTHFLEVGSGATLNLDHATTYAGSSDSNGINVDGTLNIGAAFTLSGVDGGGAGTPGQINNTGLIHVLSGGSLVRNTNSGTVTVTPAIQNDGTVSVQTGILNNGSGGLTQASGLTTVAAGATYTGNVALNGGTLGGNGTVSGAVTNTTGTVAPGASPGTLTVTGDYTQGSGGTFAEEITGTTPGTQFDRLLVGGTATLGGTLAINSTGFTPAAIDTFKIISGAISRAGTFASLTGATVNGETYSDRYDADGVTLLVSGPPPPPQETLSVTFAGSGAGSVSDGASLNCAASCQNQYVQGTVVTLVAASADGSTFTGWSGACAGTGNCQVTMTSAKDVTATFDTIPPPPPVVTTPPAVTGGNLFCGAQHRGKCTGLKVKTDFSGPGNASWTFAAYNPSPGHAAARAAVASKVIALGKIKRTITKAGTQTVVFKLRPGSRTTKLYKQVKKLKLKSIRITLTFVDSTGKLVTIQRVRLKL
jgi:hypothetical protein